MTKQDILNMFTNKDCVVTFNADKYDSLQVVVSDNNGGLIWRKWNYESDFEYELNKTVEFCKDKADKTIVADWNDENNAIHAERETIVNINENVFVEIMKQTLSDWLTEKVLAVRYVVCFNNHFIDCATLEKANDILDSFVALATNKANAFNAVIITSYKNVDLCKNELLHVKTGEVLAVEYQVYVNDFLKVGGNDYQTALNVYSFEKIKQANKPDYIIQYKGDKTLIEFNDFIIAVNVSTNRSSKNYGKWFYLGEDNKHVYFDNRQLAVESAINYAINNYQSLKIISCN